jgi:DNA polymerase-3 subunit delta
VELMRILKKGNPYVIGELKRQASEWTSPQLFQILGLMREYDAKSKGMNTGSASEAELLREMLMKIFMS